VYNQGKYMSDTLTPEQIADNARANKATKPPKNTGKGKTKPPAASTVHDDGLELSVLEAQTALQVNRQAIIAKAIADQNAEDKTLYFNARLATSQNNVAFFESIDYQNLSGRSAKKTAHILNPVQPQQRQLAAASDSQETIPAYSVDEFLDGLDLDLEDY
jgi:hypothetical protein